MLDSVLAYINNHPEEEITMDKLARISGYSLHHLHRKLSEELNEPIGNYIIRQRIQMAAYLLAITNLKIDEIKSLVGYNNSSAFARAFKSNKKTSPTQFRKQQKEILKNNYSSVKYISLSHEIVNIENQEAYIFPHLCNYFEKESYIVWEKVEKFLLDNELNKEDFEYYSILHDCPNVNSVSSLRYDAAIVSKKHTKLSLSKLFKTTVLGGKFIKYKFCCSVEDYTSTSLTINKHLFGLENISHSYGASYFKFKTIPDYKNPDNLFIEWYLPIN